MVDDPAELAEVVRLCAEGWNLAPDAPVWAFLPAIWPRNLRTWVPDTVVRTVTVWDADGQHEELPTEHDLEETDADLDAICALAGFTSRPHGRLWLLRPIGDWTPVHVCAEAMERLERTPRGAFRASPMLTAVTREIIQQAQDPVAAG